MSYNFIFSYPQTGKLPSFFFPIFADTARFCRRQTLFSIAYFRTLYKAHFCKNSDFYTAILSAINNLSFSLPWCIIEISKRLRYLSKGREILWKLRLSPWICATASPEFFTLFWFTESDGECLLETGMRSAHFQIREAVP